jgi:hypothetical protein
LTCIKHGQLEHRSPSHEYTILVYRVTTNTRFQYVPVCLLVAATATAYVDFAPRNVMAAAIQRKVRRTGKINGTQTAHTLNSGGIA